MFSKIMYPRSANFVNFGNFGIRNFRTYGNFESLEHIAPATYVGLSHVLRADFWETWAVLDTGQ